LGAIATIRSEDIEDAGDVRELANDENSQDVADLIAEIPDFKDVDDLETKAKKEIASQVSAVWQSVKDYYEELKAKHIVSDNDTLLRHAVMSVFSTVPAKSFAYT